MAAGYNPKLKLGGLGLKEGRQIDDGERESEDELCIDLLRVLSATTLVYAFSSQLIRVVNVADGGGGNRTWVCNYCNERVVGSYTKVKGHLLWLPHHNVEGCLSISNEVLEAITKEHEAAEAKKAQLALNARKKAEYVTIPKGFDLLQQKKTKEWPLEEKEYINRLLQPVKDTWKKRGVSLVSDGWSDRQCRSMINIMAASTGGAMFIKAIDASGNTKDAEYVAKLVLTGGDQFDIEGQEVAELAQLSLDEPKLERMTFQDVEAGEEQLDGDEV
ncbi:hypothetical protein RHMOL_Rhmol09G0072900 [Rhododendron molle]|uniref:Uncharacterized protein n=1 Tax=Rhododendron molle TaxID=49168 RepID=A0ACC0MAJ1_RHOML|nr:hypothetical protein RHMOL_Rhmol09G0072900 [Rhododendron molle]